MTWLWVALSSAAGTVLGCLAYLAIAVIRWSGGIAVKTWRIGEAEPEREKEPVS